MQYNCRFNHKAQCLAWIFQIAGTLILSTGVRVTLSGGALASNIVWVVSGAVTSQVRTHLEGVVLGQTGITLQTGSSINGRVLAQTSVALQIVGYRANVAYYTH